MTGTPAPKSADILAPATEAEKAAVASALDGAPLTSLFGDACVAEFERAFAERFDYPHAAAVSSGTSALHASLQALGVGPGDEVIVTPFSFVASVSVVVQAGAVPVFADIDPHTFTLRPDAVRARVTGRTKAVLPVHINGFPADMDGLLEVAREHGLAVVEDCAAAHGASIGDRHVGGFGDTGCFSFNIAKVMRTGEGGMVVTRDAALDERLRRVRVNGMAPGSTEPNGIECLGFNYTMAQPLAAIGVEQVRGFTEVFRRRAENEALLSERLGALGVTVPVAREGSTRSAYASPFLLPAALAGDGKKSVIAGLKRRGVPASSGCGTPLYRIGYLRPYAPEGGLPVTEEVCSRLLVLDPRPELDAGELNRWCDEIEKVLRDHDA
jgi:perosamine synthetase